MTSGSPNTLPHTGYSLNSLCGHVEIPTYKLLIAAHEGNPEGFICPDGIGLGAEPLRLFISGL